MCIRDSSAVDRATIGATVIGAGTKIDNLVQIAHNCQLGRENIIVANVAIGGSTTLGDRVIVAGSAAIKDHMKIGKDAIVEGKAAAVSYTHLSNKLEDDARRPMCPFMRMTLYS